jgi:hypothetical protein
MYQSSRIVAHAEKKVAEFKRQAERAKLDLQSDLKALVHGGVEQA